MQREHPLIGVTSDIVQGSPLASIDPGAPPVRARHQTPATYIEAIVRAGGVPIILPAVPALAPNHARLCDGFVFIGGDDPRMEAFGVATHPAASPMPAERQEYELSLLREIDRVARERDAASTAPATLGICLGMQLMALHAGGTLNQHLPDTLPTAARHVKDFAHAVQPLQGPHARHASGACFTFAPGLVASNHHQAVSSAGRLRVIATSDDGVIEAVDDPSRPFYLGVQWHPERTRDQSLGQGVFDRLVAAAHDARLARANPSARAGEG